MFSQFRLAAIACLLFAHCAATVKIMPAYKEMNFEKSKLGIVLLRENLNIANPEDVAENLGDGEIKQVFCEFFTSEFKEYAEQYGGFAEVNVVNDCETSGFTEITKQVSSKYLTADNYVYIRDPARRTCPGDSFHYLLILDDIDVAREKRSGATVVLMNIYGRPVVMRTGDSDKLIIRGRFMLWDNLTGRIAAFGQISDKKDVLAVITRNTWVNFVENFSWKIFADLTDDASD